MEQLGDSGNGTSNHLSQTSNNITVPLDTTLMDKEIVSYAGPTGSESDRKQLSQSLQTSKGQILAQHQHNKSCVRNSVVSIPRQTGQSRNPGCIAVLPKENGPQHESKQCCSSGGLPERFVTDEKLLLQKCPIQLSSLSSESQNASFASAITSVSQQFMPHMIVLNANKFNGSWKNNLYSQQQHVKITNISPKDSICQGLFTDVGHIGVILAEGQSINLCHQNVYMPKDIHQQKYIPQKAIAVVTPLTQQVVEGVTFSKNWPKVNEQGLERSVPNKKEHQTFIPHMLKSATNESDLKTSQTSQAKEVLGTKVSDCLVDDGSAEDNKLSGQSEKLSSVFLNSVSIERKEELQTYPTEDNCSAKFLNEDDAGVMVRNSEETQMNAKMDRLSTIPVNEWSRQRLCTLVTELEQTQEGLQKDISFNDLSSEILKLYWNGDYHKFCNAAKSNMYFNIMKDVKLHSGTENSVILQEVSRERLSEIASNFYILEHDIAPPKMAYTSSWLSLSEKLDDIDKDHDKEHYLSSVMTLHCKTTNAEKEVTVTKKQNLQELKSDTIKASNKALSKGEKLSNSLFSEHQKNLSVKGNKIEGQEPLISDAENVCSVKETKGQDSMPMKNVMTERAQSEKQNKMEDENGGHLVVSLSTESSEVSDGSKKSGNLLNIPTTDMTPALDKKDDFADCVSVEMSIVSPAGEPLKEKQKEDAQTLADKKDEVTVKLFDQDKKHIDPEIKLGEQNNQIKVTWHLENYCCLAKWFQVLGYKNGGLCMCEKKSELNHQNDVSGNGMKEVNADMYRHSFTIPCKPVPSKNRLGYRHMTGKKSSPINDDDASIDEIEIVDVITNYEDVLKMANAMSEQLVETPHLACTSHESITGIKHCRDNQKVMTMTEFKARDTLINLALFGTSHLSQKKKKSWITSSDKVPCPPEIINVRIGSGRNESSNCTKQQVWNSWKNTHLPSNKSTTKRSKKRKHANALAPKNAAADNTAMKTTALTEDAQTLWSATKNGNTLSVVAAEQKNTARHRGRKKARKKICSTRKDKLRKLKQNKMLVNLNKKWVYTNNNSKRTKSSFDPVQADNTSKNKLNMDVALNFRVLPESFNISEGSSSREASQSASAESGSKGNAVLRLKRTWGISGTTWCVSPRKKQCVQSTPTLPNTSGPSTFQKFKKKYEEKKQSIAT